MGSDDLFIHSARASAARRAARLLRGSLIDVAASSSSPASPANTRSPCSNTLTASASRASRAISALSSRSLIPTLRWMPRRGPSWYSSGYFAGNVPDHARHTKPKSSSLKTRDATGEVAEVYDEWRAKSGRQQMPGILKCFSHRPDFLRDVMQVQRHGAFFPGAPRPQNQGSDRELGLVAQSLPVLTGLACILPACSGSRRKYGAGDSARQSGRSRA